MKRILIILCSTLLLASCGTNVERLQMNVKASIEQELQGRMNQIKSLAEEVEGEPLDLDMSEEEYTPIVKDVSLVRVSGNRYEGFAEIERMGITMKKRIEVTVDGRKFLWSME